MISRFTFLCLLVLAFSTNSEAQYIYTFAGTGYGASTGTGGYSGDGGLAKQARLNSPTGVAYDGIGNIYIADRANNVVRKVAVNGIITTFAGKDTAGYSGDNGQATAAKLNLPFSVATDVHGNVYISDGGNNVIRKVTPGGIISTYAGTGVAGYSGDMGPATAAMLNGPQGIATDSMGNLYIADANNHAVRKVWVGGTIGTIAGNGLNGYTGDGGSAVNARLYSPAAVAIDPLGQIYIADYFNNAVRKINGSGIITTFAGTGSAGYSGDGGSANAAKLRNPSGVAVFGFGPVFISDQGNNVVRIVNNSGIISNYAGMYTNGYTGDGWMAVSAQMSAPKGIAVDALNRLFIADYDNNVIRVVGANNAVQHVVNETGLKVYPNPAHGVVTVEVAGSDKTTLTVTDLLGRTVATKIVENTTTIDLGGFSAGSYFIKAVSGEAVYCGKIEVQ